MWENDPGGLSNFERFRRAEQVTRYVIEVNLKFILNNLIRVNSNLLDEICVHKLKLFV